VWLIPAPEKGLFLMKKKMSACWLLVMRNGKNIIERILCSLQENNYVNYEVIRSLLVPGTK
jgi:hypothetical protein